MSHAASGTWDVHWLLQFPTIPHPAASGLLLSSRDLLQASVGALLVITFNVCSGFFLVLTFVGLAATALTWLLVVVCALAVAILVALYTEPKRRAKIEGALCVGA